MEEGQKEDEDTKYLQSIFLSVMLVRMRSIDSEREAERTQGIIWQNAVA
jgi:hypothetical protein